jgi:alpha-1,2-mannosyltransferase
MDSPVGAPLAMVVTAAFGLVASPTSWGHHWVYAIPAILVMLAYAIRRRHIGYLIAAAASALVFFYAPFMHESGHGPGLLARIWYQIYSNGYTALAILLLLLFAAPAVVHWSRRPRRSRARSAEAKSGNPKSADADTEPEAQPA